MAGLHAVPNSAPHLDEENDDPQEFRIHQPFAD